MHSATLSLAIIFLQSVISLADDRDRMAVGIQPDGSILTPTNQLLKPTGSQVLFPGRPVDVVLVDDGKTAVAKNMRSLEIIDTATGKGIQTLALPTQSGGKAVAFSAVGLIAINGQLLVTDSQDSVRVAKKGVDGKYEWDNSRFVLPPPMANGAAYPTGLTADGATLWVCGNRSNELVQFDLTSKKVTAKVTVGVAPYQPVVVGQKVYVSNWGGDHPADPKAITTSGTPVRIDPRTSIANHGSVSVVEMMGDQWKQTKTIAVGGHPSGIATSKNGKFVYVANANSDTVSVIDTAADKVIETIDCKPEKRLPFGSGSNALTLSLDGQTLYVANGTNNCIAVVELGSMSGGRIIAGETRPSQISGLIPTGWYPGAVVVSAESKSLVVANVKGHGSLSDRREKAKGKNSHDHLGSVSIIPIPSAVELKKQTETVNANNRLGYALSGLEKPRPDAKPMPVPERHGEPSVIRHVIYVIKENRTYDQVFGDMKEGNGDKNLCLFGEDVTPNMHKMAREFVLLDNYYCSGVLSADGHSWVNEAYTTDYLEKQFGQFVRSYPYEGSDPLAFPTTGFLWDNALAHKKTFYNFGEHCKTTNDPKGAKWMDLYEDYLNGTNKVKVTVEPNLPSLKPYSHPNYPGFPLNVPDVWRAKLLLKKLKEWEKSGEMPNLVYVFLPADHTQGTRPDSPTPRAMNADGDLALGQIVDAFSHSKFWSKTCVFVTMDDPQNGFDHVDGHRTVGLAVSPYTRQKGVVDSTCYNQTGMVKTIELMLGIPPMNQLDLTATPFRNCFTDKPDLTPYQLEKNRIKLDEMNPPLKKLNGPALTWAQKSMELDFTNEDQADEDTLNRILWFSVHGNKAYPKDGR